MTSQKTSLTKNSAIPFYRDERVLQIAAQIISALLIFGFLAWAVLNFIRAADARNMNLTFGFLKEAAGFPISNPPIDYEPAMSFGRAFLVGLVNTLIVSGAGIVTATILGTLVALARLSKNWLLSRIALVFIEFHRNIPLLVLLFIWYFVVFGFVPPVKDSLVWPGPIYINKRGIYLSWLRLTETGSSFVFMAVIGIAAAVIVFTVLRRIRKDTGRKTYFFPASLALMLLFFLGGWF
ncbi:MAG: ABC transporter permease subunit, partial [Anaerolineales bacterium]